MKHRFIILLLCTTIVITALTQGANALRDPHPFVRTADYYLMSGEKLDQPETIRTLASFDLIVIPLEAQDYNPTFFKTIRELNKNIIILAYVPTVSWNDIYWFSPTQKKLYKDIQSDWWLKDGTGKQISVWPGTRALNLNSGWSTYLATFTQDYVLSTGYWDGIFYDEVQDSISWVGNVDVNKDGLNDSSTDADKLWEKKYIELFSHTRSLVGSKPIIITNGSSKSAFAEFVNGRMFESFPSTSSSLSDWSNSTNDYLTNEKIVGYDPVSIVNVNTDNTGNKNDFQKMRFGITTTLLGNGYFGFDFGTEDHSQLWTYDEYKTSLGKAKDVITKVAQGIWQRNFEQGKVVVNATTNPQTIDLNGDFEKIHGTQDTSVNDGSIVSQITLAAKDGIILLRPIERIENAVFQNGAFARIFSANGKAKRTGFFAYENAFKGGVQIILKDLNNDGNPETVVADETNIQIFDSNNQLIVTFAPYTSNYKNGINFAINDLEGDGTIEIVTGTGKGGGPQVRVFNKDGKLISPGFFAYDKNFRGGVNIAIGDLNNDGTKEIITGAGFSGGPHIRMFRKDGKLINPGFFAYDKNFRGGVNIASGDVDSDGTDDIITSPGIGGSPEVRIFDRNGIKKFDFFTSDIEQKDGLKISVSDVDSDGFAEIISLSTNVFTLSGY